MRKESLKIGSRIVFSLLLTALAWPAWGANCPNKIGKIAIVAKSGGNYTSPVTAMSDIASWCGTPSEASGCLIKIMPGVYDLAGGSLTMLPYVDIDGAGENETTISSATNSSGVVNGAANVSGEVCAEISNLTVKNTASSGGTAINIGNQTTATITNVTATVKGNGDTNYGINIFQGGYASMSNVTASASGSTSNYGVCIGDGRVTTLSHVTATAEGGSFSYGVWVGHSNEAMDNVTATASGATKNYGVYNADSQTTLSHVTATAKGGSFSYGVYNCDGGLTMSHVTATASGATSNYGLYNIFFTSPSDANADLSTFQGSTSSVFTDTPSGSGAIIAYSELVGPADDGAGTLTCIHSYNGNYVPLGANCQGLSFFLSSQ